MQARTIPVAPCQKAYSRRNVLFGSVSALFVGEHTAFAQSDPVKLLASLEAAHRPTVVVQQSEMGKDTGLQTPCLVNQTSEQS